MCMWCAHRTWGARLKTYLRKCQAKQSDRELVRLEPKRKDTTPLNLKRVIADRDRREQVLAAARAARNGARGPRRNRRQERGDAEGDDDRDADRDSNGEDSDDEQVREEPSDSRKRAQDLAELNAYLELQAGGISARPKARRIENTWAQSEVPQHGIGGQLYVECDDQSVQWDITWSL